MILAAQYYRPPFPERRYWKEDLDGMKDAGLNAVQLWVLWSWVEPEPGRFDFSDYDELVEEAGKRGLGVVLSSIAELHPFWIHREIPDAHMIDHMGRAVISTNRGEAHQGLTPGGCTDNPEVLRRMGAFLETVGSRYATAPNLVGWDIWNELRWNVQADGLVCFCPHTLRAFRGWLDAKYGGLDGLNAAWKRRYCDWADVMPGKLPKRPYTEMMAFEKFLQWRAAEQMRFRAEIIKRADPTHIVTGHGAQPSAHMAGDAENHAINRGNDWDLVKPLDGVGCSHFPFWFAMSDADFGVRVECTRSAAGDKTVWVSELQGGSARQGFDVRPSVEAKPQQRWVWNGYGRGAKAVIFWCWRDEFFGRESSGYGLAGRDGLAEERIALMKQTGSILREHNALLEAYRPDAAKVGVLFDPNGYNLEWAQDGVAARARDSVTGYLTALEHLQVPYTLVESSHLAALQRPEGADRTLPDRRARCGRRTDRRLRPARRNGAGGERGRRIHGGGHLPLPRGRTPVGCGLEHRGSGPPAAEDRGVPVHLRQGELRPARCHLDHAAAGEWRQRVGAGRRGQRPRHGTTESVRAP